MSRKILVMGGTRFFGKKLVQKLVENGDDITIATRGNKPNPFPNQSRHVIFDRNDLSTLSQIKNEKWDLIYDQICMNHKHASSAVEIFKDKVNQYIFTSSGAVYDLCPNFLKEEAFNPKSFNIQTMENNYADEKRSAEHIFTSASFLASMIRFPFVIGNDDYTKRTFFYYDSIIKDKSIFFINPEFKCSWISSEEAADFLVFVGLKKITGPINACSDNPITMKKFIQICEKTLNKKAKIEKIESENYDVSPYGLKQNYLTDTTFAKNAGFVFQDTTDNFEALFQLFKDSSL
jgi:nucleoside-diphosphate-sugar epimerase